MFKWIKKIFIPVNNKENIMTNTTTQPAVTNNTVKLASTPANNVKRLEIEIFDKIIQGEPPYEQTVLEKVHYDNPVIIEVASKQDLQDFAEKLKLCNQTFKIVKVLDNAASATSTNTQPAAVQPTVNNIQTANTTVSTTTNVEHQQTSTVKPKYYKIGNIEIKDDNGKIYQKQWLKLTDTEMSNFRIVNNKTNAVINLKDKSLEMKKWVLVEDTEDTTSNLEGMLND